MASRLLRLRVIKNIAFASSQLLLLGALHRILSTVLLCAFASTAFGGA